MRKPVPDIPPGCERLASMRTGNQENESQACFYCHQAIEWDPRGNFCLVIVTKDGKVMTDENGDPWLAILCAECGHSRGVKTVGELEAIGEATIEPIDPAS